VSKKPAEQPPEQDAHGNKSRKDLLALVQQALNGLQYGKVTLIVQDGVVIQVNRIEKKRVPRSAH
jgi:hypothetical protein